VSEDRLVRRAARVLLIDEQERVLLIEGRDPAEPQLGTWWITPGGGREGDETPVQAAVREVREETGLRLPAVDGPVWQRTATFFFDGVLIEQHEDYFTARVRHFSPVGVALTDLERRATQGMRWWTIHEIERTEERVFPENLTDLLRAALTSSGPVEMFEGGETG
jgi:8-oxo-dGTP pyrophosphatase MutT (NUDIX family)